MDRELATVIVIIFVTSSLSVYFLATNLSESVSVMKFEENDEMIFYIDGNGNVSVEAQMRLPPSPFSDFLSYVAVSYTHLTLPTKA